MNLISTHITKIFFIPFALILFSFVLEAQETVTDIDGNVYTTVTIGTQVWMKENLKTTHYRNGDAIPNVTNASIWIGLTTGAYCNYNNDTAVSAIYGRLYNWYTVIDNRDVCPAGWHIPTDTEWSALFAYLGGESIAGGKLKETGTTHWISPNTGATNETGFTALPGGTRTVNGTFFFIGFNSQWWRSTEYDTNNARTWNVSYDQGSVGHSDFGKKTGFSVRCIKEAVQGVDDSENGKQIPFKMELYQNYPNPFNPSTVISYRLSAYSNVKLSIYNVLGQKIKKLVNGFQNAGEHSLVWDATDEKNNPVSSGIYIYSLQTDKMTIQKKMVLVR